MLYICTDFNKICNTNDRDIVFLKNRSILLILMSFLLLSFSPYNDSFSSMKIINDTPSIKSNNFEYINYSFRQVIFWI